MTSQSRRTTLGPISQSTLNSRMSIGRPSLGPQAGAGLGLNKPSRVSIGPSEGYPMKAPPRVSLGGNPSGRRSSIGIAAAPRKSSVTGRMSMAAGMRITSDPRNIGDKAFMQNSLKTLIGYLSDHGFDHPISLKILTRPAVKDFSNIINFLFKQIDPSFTSTGKFEDDVVTWFKQLGYPFQIAKSHITAVGSPHAWPSLLGCIMWMIELLSYDEAAAIGSYIDSEQGDYEDPDMDPDDPSTSIKVFYRYISRAYKLFLACEDDKAAILEDQFVKLFDNSNVLIQDQISHLENSIRSLETEISEYEKRRAYLPELESKKRDYIKDKGKFEQLIDQLEKHKEQLEMKTDARRHELNKLNEAISILQSENDGLRQRISVQELTPEDVRNMIAERERLEEAQQTASEIRQQLHRKVWETETALKDKVQSLEDFARAYNAIAEDLKLIPSTAKNAHGKNLAVEIDIKTKKRSTILKCDVRTEIVPILKEFVEGLKEETKSNRDILSQHQDALEELDMQAADLEDTKAQLEAKLRRAEESYRREKEALEAAAEVHAKEMDSIEAKLFKLRDTTSDESRYIVSMRKQAEINALRESRRVDYERQKKELIGVILETVTSAANHREYARKCIGEVKESFSKQLEEFFSKGEATPLTIDHKRMTEKAIKKSSSFDPLPPQPSTGRHSNIIGSMPDISPIGGPVDELVRTGYNDRPRSSIIYASARPDRKTTYNFAGLINECAKSDHNLLDESIQIDFRDV